MHTKFETVGTYTPQNLISRDIPRRDKKVTMSFPADRSAGALIMNQSGNFEPATNALVGDASEIAILAHDVAAGNDQEVIIWLTGGYFESGLDLGDVVMTDGIRSSMRGNGVYLD